MLSQALLKEGFAGFVCFKNGRNWSKKYFGQMPLERHNSTGMVLAGHESSNQTFTSGNSFLLPCCALHQYWFAKKCFKVEHQCEGLRHRPFRLAGPPAAAAVSENTKARLTATMRGSVRKDHSGDHVQTICSKSFNISQNFSKYFPRFPKHVWFGNVWVDSCPRWRDCSKGHLVNLARHIQRCRSFQRKWLWEIPKKAGRVQVLIIVDHPGCGVRA